MTALTDSVTRRRTFAIISHPDAGKTTLTEKLLLFGGAIQMAGAVKARGEQRRRVVPLRKRHCVLPERDPEGKARAGRGREERGGQHARRARALTSGNHAPPTTRASRH